MSKTNFFDTFSQRPDVAARQGGQVPGRNVPPQQAYQGNDRPSPVVPGARVPGRDTGNHLQDRMDDVDAGGGSPLAKFMKGGHNTNRGGQQIPQGQQQPAASGAGGTPPQSPTPKEPTIWDAGSDLFKTAFGQQAENFLPADVTEDDYKKAFSGDFQAFQALQRKLNVHTASMTAHNMTRITKAGLDKEFAAFTGKLPDTLKQHQFSDLFRGVDHPLVQDKAVKPLLHATTQFFRDEFPNATPEEIREGVLAYMEEQLGSRQTPQTDRKSRNLASHFDGAAYEGFEED